MKTTILSLVLLFALLLSGCSLVRAERTLDSIEDRVETKLDQTEDAIEATLEPKARPSTPPAETPAETPKETPTEAPAKASPALSREDAQRIALQHAGLTSDEVSRLRTEYEVDDGVPQYEVQFDLGRWEYDYDIHAETGAVLSFDKDD